MITIRNIKQLPSFYLFVIVGTIGFIVDAGILSGVVYLLEWNPYIARAASFSLALMITWLLNSKWTFHNRITRKKHHEFYLYVFIQTSGIILNYSIYSGLLIMSIWLTAYPAVSVAISSIVAMSFNYLTLRYCIFKPNE